MDLDHFFTLLVATDQPWLPGTTLARWALQGAWALLLGTGVLALAGVLKRKRLTRWAWAVLVALWALWPGPLSPAHWLGLAFQSPSLMTQALCLGWLWQQGRGQQARPLAWPLCSGAVLLGWVLLLDLLACWPVSVYAWGFSPAALALLCLLTLLGWLSAGQRASGQRSSAMLAVLLLLFALTRLPSGNVWDVVLDPWLWLLLQVNLLARVATAIRAATATAAVARR